MDNVAEKKTAESDGAAVKENEKETQSPSDTDESISIKSISKDMVDKVVTIRGKITNVRKHENGHLFLEVTDDTGKIDVPIFADKKIPTDQLKLGKQFQFTGMVDEYNGSLEVIPSSSKDVELIKKNNVEITKENIGKSVEIEAKVITKYRHPKGHVFLTVELTDQQQEIEVPIFDTLQYNSDEIAVNSILKIKGNIGEYNGKLEVIPQAKTDIAILEAGKDSDVSLVEVSRISESNRGKMVQVRGSVKNVTEKDGHLYFYLSDGNKEIKGVLFKADGNEIAGRKLKIQNAAKENFPIRVLAMVDVYNGELELIIDKVFNEY